MATPKLCSVEGCGKSGVMRRGFCGNHYKRFQKYGDPSAGGTSPGVPLAWVKDHVAHEGDGCLIWPFGQRGDGRGSVKINGEDRRVQSVMCEMAHGPAPTTAHEAAHSCGKGSSGCVHPQHLRWATRKENQADRLLHGTDSRGEKSASCILTAEQVIEIRALKGAVPRPELARRYGVSVSAIGDIFARRNWAWL